MKNEKLYEKYLQGRHWKQHPTIYAERFVEFLKQNNFQGRLVDLGCGTGRDVSVFQKAGFNVLGLDYSESEISRARQNYPDCSFDVQDIEKLNFEDQSMDAYFMINVIHYVDQKKVFSEIVRTFKPGGFLFIHFNLKIMDEDGNIDYLQEEAEVKELFEGFNVLENHIFKRADTTPVNHTHTIFEVILQRC